MHDWRSWVAVAAVIIIVWLFFGRHDALGARILRGPALWTGSSPSKGTQRNRRMRGHGTWGQEIRNITQAEQRKLRRRRGKGTWSKESANLYRLQRRQERQERRNRSLLHKLMG
jgi:hypothetical protein